MKKYEIESPNYTFYTKKKKNQKHYLVYTCRYLIYFGLEYGRGGGVLAPKTTPINCVNGLLCFNYNFYIGLLFVF